MRDLFLLSKPFLRQNQSVEFVKVSGSPGSTEVLREILFTPLNPKKR